MNNSESARKLNQAVNTTSKAVGGALSQAKGAFSNFWSTFTAPTVTANTISSDDLRIPTIITENESEQISTEVDGVAKQSPKKIQDNELNSTLKEEKDIGSKVNDGVVEIGREANIIDTNRKNDIIDV